MRSHKHLYMGTWLSSLCPGVKKYLRAQCYNDHDEASHWSDTQIGVAVCCRSLNAVLHMPTWCLKKNNGKGIEPRLWDAEAVKTGWPYVIFGTGLYVALCRIWYRATSYRHLLRKTYHRSYYWKMPGENKLHTLSITSCMSMAPLYNWKFVKTYTKRMSYGSPMETNRFQRLFCFVCFCNKKLLLRNNNATYELNNPQISQCSNILL